MLHSSLLHLPSEKHPAEAAQIDWHGRFEVLAEQARDPRLKTYYSAGMPLGSTPIEDVPLMALDVETTGLNPMKDGIVSIGLVPMSLNRIQASRAKHWIVQPHVPLADESVTLHHITHTQVENAPKLLDVLDPFLHTIAGHVLVVHCRAIERQFLNNALTRMIHEPLEMPMIDTMELEARLHRKEPGAKWWRRLLGRKQARASIRLAASRERYNLPFYKPHHAVTDALATAELFQAQIFHRFSPQTPLDDLWR